MSFFSVIPHRYGSYYGNSLVRPERVFGERLWDDARDLMIAPLLWGELIAPQQLQSRSKSSKTSDVTNDANKFVVKLDVNHFKPEEITVKTVDNAVVIHGKHEEKTDDHGSVSREFTRKYTLPDECDPKMVLSSLSSNGFLTIEAPKKPIEAPQLIERVIPITVNRNEEIRENQTDSNEKPLEN